MTPLLYRYNVVEFYVWTNAKYLEKNINSRDIPVTHRTRSKKWSHTTGICFFEDGSCRLIREFSFQIDTGNHPSICCKPPSYGRYEYEVILNLVGWMDETFVVKDNNGPWGEMLVLAAKPHQ